MRTSAGKFKNGKGSSPDVSVFWKRTHEVGSLLGFLRSSEPAVAPSSVLFSIFSRVVLSLKWLSLRNG